jgi:hypothetical protein
MSSSDYDSDDRTVASPTGTPGVPGGCPDLSPTEGSSTGSQPRATAPAGSNTNNQPRPEDFMSRASGY